MSQNPVSLTLAGDDPQQHLTLSKIHYQGHGAYTCNVSVESNGFSCHKPFNFDNDEYFLAKLKEVLTTQSGDAELLDLQSDNFLKIHALDTNTVLVNGLILEARPFAQSLEFAFATRYEMLERFADKFTRMVQANT